METTPSTEAHTLDTLNELARGELSAVETYRQALEKVKDATLRATLQENWRLHQQRAQLLRSKVIELGGKPVEGSGAWGAFAKLVEGGARMFGEKSAISALEEGEDRGLKMYRDAVQKVDAN